MKTFKNKTIEPHQNTTISYQGRLLWKKFIIITSAMPSMYIWVSNHLFLTLLIFLKIITKKHDSSAEFLCTPFCHQKLFLYIIDILFSSLLLFPFFFPILCLFPLNLWPEEQLLLLFYSSISGLVQIKMKTV